MRSVKVSSATSLMVSTSFRGPRRNGEKAHVNNHFYGIIVSKDGFSDTHLNAEGVRAAILAISVP